MLSVLSGDDLRLYSKPLVYSAGSGIIGIDIDKRTFYKRAFAFTMKSLFGENLLLFVKLKHSALMSKHMKEPLENRHHHSFTKNYEKAINGCQKYFHIKLPEGAPSNFKSGSYMATMVVRF
ncbi:hypothetical protein HpCHN105_12680 [Helicobacter pylori]|uniref:hypothetical protein n=1 Tax=Helicobacter pylori TaxID=210 RepID=UPI000EB1C7EA|nr:hypothetical protein [Helicobacter pylori]TPH96193.1 hypothetical protein FIM40_04300 [Helicobacter pylori]